MSRLLFIWFCYSETSDGIHMKSSLMAYGDCFDLKRIKYDNWKYWIRHLHAFTSHSVCSWCDILSDAFTTYIRMLCFGKINEFRQTWIKYAFALVLWNIHISTWITKIFISMRIFRYRKKNSFHPNSCFSLLFQFTIFRYILT